MNSEQLIPLSVPIAYLMMLASEKRIASRDFPIIKNWQATGLVFFVILLVTSMLIPLVIPTEKLAANSVFNLQSWGLWGVPVALLITTFFSYWFHRAEHHFNWMWRVFHQLHHSAERVDILGAFYTHPLEPAAKMIISAIIASYLLCLDPIAVVIVSSLTGLLSMFQHWNITTPHWLGYLVPRPESHCLHHERNVHARNYGDLPIWDMMFGTYLNPRAAINIQVGFAGNPSKLLSRMLLMQVVEQQQFPQNRASTSDYH